ncbi:MAG: hypothetical protein ACLFQB_16250 [Chitinispirillaceae bacterium]
MARISKTQQIVAQLASFLPPVGPETPLHDEKIPTELILEPNMPVGVYVQEAYNLYHYAQDDREILVSKGLDWGIVEELPRRIENLRDREANWWKARFGPTPSQREYLRVRAMAERAREELMRDFRFLARSDDDILYAVENIEKGSGELDTVKDVNSLSELAKREKGKLQAIGSDPKFFEDIVYCAQRYPDLLSVCELEQAQADYQQTYRNQAYTFLLVAVEEIRRCASHAFWSDKKYLKGYQSEYFRRTKSG